MKYITAKQFLEQPESVQKVFIDWWEPDIGDSVFDKRHNQIAIVIYRVVNAIKKWFDIYLLKSKRSIVDHEDLIPLLTMQQLIDFVEDKKDCIIDLNSARHTIAGARTYIRLYDIVGNYKQQYIIENEIDKLAALWQVACKIALEVSEKVSKI